MSAIITPSPATPAESKNELRELRRDLERLRRILRLVLVLGVGAGLTLGYCARYFRKRCNGFEKKLDTIHLHQLTHRIVPSEITAPAPVAPSVTTPPPSPSLPSRAALVENPSGAWQPPALPGGLPPPADVAPLLARLAKSDVAPPARPLFDELDLFEQGNRVFFENASYYFRSHGAYAGRHCFEVQLEDAAGAFGRILVQPRLFTLASGSKLSLAFRKSRAEARLWMGIVTRGGGTVVAHETSGKAGPGQIAHVASSAWHELELEPHRMAREQGVDLASGRVQAFFFGLTHGAAGDSLFVDRVWQGPTAVSGVPSFTGTVRLSGRVSGPPAGVSVMLVHGPSKQQTAVTSSGDYAFEGLPAGAVVELWAEKDGHRYFSPSGDTLHLTTDTADAHLLTEDMASLRGAGTVRPEWSNYGGPGVEEYDTKFPPHKPMFYTGAVGHPLEYSATLIPNRFGVYDRDHRFEDPDQRTRLLILGDCQLEGIQTELYQRVGPRLESVLRRRHGKDVEVFTLAHSNAHPAAVWSMYEKLGRKFRPDVVLIDVNAPSVVQMEPRLLRNLTGWDPEHSASGSMVLTADERLRYVPPDPNYPVFAGKPSYAPLQGVPPNWVLHIKEDQFSPEARDVARLFKAVIAKYVMNAREYGARVAVYTGSRAGTYPKPQAFENKVASQDQYVENMKRWAREAGAEHIDISKLIQSKHPRFDKIHFWKNDGHPTETGHHWMAEGLAEQLIAAGLVR